MYFIHNEICAISRGHPYCTPLPKRSLEQQFRRRESLAWGGWSGGSMNGTSGRILVPKR